MEQQQQVKNITKPIVKILLTVLFLCCLLDMPYGYFQLVRFVGMTGFIVLAYLDKEKEDKTIMIIWICSALLINPIFKIALGRSIWNIVDVIWSIILLTTLIIDYNADRKKNHS
ncbi:MAG: hypothetical protein KF732_07415, partial [Flavobacteriales bacterium]|nr:hypothetical protein [Flavobacteriales bacterium]